MKIDIHTLISQSSLDFQGEQLVSLVGLQEAKSKLDCIAKVSGSVTRDGDRYLVSATVEADLLLICDRCMKPYHCRIHTQLCSEYSTDLAYLEKHEDARPIAESNIDLSDEVAEAILIDMPMKSLCMENCKGLCVVCGMDLNQDACTCNRTGIDPRLEQFKGIFCDQGKK